MIVGMDFGTTNSGIAAYNGQQIQLIPIDPANPDATVARSALYITNDRHIRIGRAAIDTYYEQNLNRPVNIERTRVGEITLTFAELPSFVRDVYIDKDVLSPGRLFLSFKTALSSLNYLGTIVGSHFYFLEDIIALYLYVAKQRAEQFLNTVLKQIVLGRPVRFAFDPKDDQLARERLLKAAFRAGYEEVYLQYEPIAAAYHYESTINREQNVLIFDFGGGTLDISVVRVGNPSNREVLANGGLPIAGDVFDQKLVRARLPKHFGEGSHYRSGGKRLPIPNSFYEAFSNWQDMLNLHQPKTLEEIQRIEETAENPRQVRALRQLIASSYGLKMYDQVETVKRQLSNAPNAAIRLQGTGFDVYEPVTRVDFERIIRQDIDMVDSYLDELLRNVGLTNADIDQVIRTGGSSQIPAFIQLLERRFGKEKVGSIDVFSSVTSGLGIMAHQIEQGIIDASPFHRRDYVLEDRLDHRAQNGVPAVDFELMKKFITLVETHLDNHLSIGLVGLTDAQQVVAVIQAPETYQHEVKLEAIGIPKSDFQTVFSAAPDDQILVCTSDYRFFRKSLSQLARLNDVGLDLAESEGFQLDVFGDEYVTGLTQWDGASRAFDIGVLVTTSGYFRCMKAEQLIARLAQSVPYQPARLKGEPLAIALANGTDTLLAFTSTGRAVSINGGWFAQQTEGRMMKVPVAERIIGLWPAEGQQTFLLAAEDGEITHLNSGDIPASEINTSGTKVFRRRTLKSVLPWRLDRAVWMMTSKRIIPLQMESIELNSTPYYPLRLDKGETLTALLSFPL
jgi:hypothetical chaperone protein